MQQVATKLKQIALNRGILIVEDDPILLENLKRMLSHFFLDVVAVDSVDAALASYAKMQELHESIVVLTDIHLGLQSGIDLTCALKAINPDQRVIAVSGTEEREVFIESIRCGVDSFILKPINKEELFSTLISILEKINYDLELKESRHLLEESKEYALRLLDEQDQFLKNAIHEIHTPLAVIITNIDLMRLQGIENEFLNSIEAGARIIENSYEDMTYLMKHDRIAEIKTTINLVEFIQNRINYFACIAQVNELSITLRIGHPNLPKIYFSELKLSRIIDNTLSNAIKYSKRPSEIQVTVGVQKKALFFAVTNQGPIISDTKKIFERFYREKKEKGGYGIGLNIVDKICQEEQIQIEVTSTRNRGTSFRYIFPNETNLQQKKSTIA